MNQEHGNRNGKREGMLLSPQEDVQVAGDEGRVSPMTAGGKRNTSSGGAIRAIRQRRQQAAEQALQSVNPCTAARINLTNIGASGGALAQDLVHGSRCIVQTLETKNDSKFALRLDVEFVVPYLLYALEIKTPCAASISARSSLHNRCCLSQL